MRDNELFELCEEVYKRTKWGDTPVSGLYFVHQNQGKTRIGRFPDTTMVSPLYTSDYLLEKLPKTIERPDDAYGALWGNPNVTLLDDGLWEASYRFEDEMNQPDFKYANQDFTPLKALLKLVIALDDAGVKL